MVIRLVNQDLPTEFSIGSQGNGGTIRKIYLEQNQCADIGAPLFEQYADIPESYSIFIPGKSGTGLQWVKPDLNSGWATLLAGTGPSCCFGQPNATGQWFYAFNPFQKDVPANFSKTYWTQQQQFMDNLPVEIPTNPPTVEIRPVPNYRGLGDVCLNNNGTAILGHPCQAGNNPNVANVQFLVMHTGANRKTSGPFPPRIWSRTDCMRVGAVYPAGYPSDVNMMRPRGQVPTAVLGPAFRKLEPISDTIKVNMTMCTIAAKPCMVYIGTLRDAARMINSGEASFHWIQYFMNMPGVPDTIMDMISDTLETLTEMLVDMGIELGSTVAEMIEAINAVDPDLSEAFAGIGENDLWDMVGKTAETTDFRRSFQIFTDMDIDAVEGIDYVTGASMGSLFAGSETDDLAEGTTAEDAGVDAAADDTTMEIIEPFMDAAVL
ncbi:hypothetical protein DFJ74DRAFT_693660 [Hyaloraphidium curvatum]|nr:hypothetical protein DFJ74DRAFT_693660 [Hyaloraphidium curvatum]